jgi:DDE superfamily endonuclease
MKPGSRPTWRRCAGWSPRGTRLKAAAPFGHWQTTTFLAALRHDRVEAPWLLDGPINGARFQVYVEQVLGPTLAPGDIVIMDNLGSHKGKAVRQAIRKVGAKLLFLPKYSPTSTRSSNSSPSSSTICAPRSAVPARRWPTQSPTSSTPLHPPNALTTSHTTDMNKPKPITL